MFLIVNCKDSKKTILQNIFKNIFYFIFLFRFSLYLHKSKHNQMEKMKPGRKKIPADQRAKLVSAYLKDTDKAAIVKKYGSLTKAVKLLIIPSL